MATGKREYTNGELTVVWQPKLCTHGGKCAFGLPKVFKPKDRPWVQMENGTTEEIENQVRQCPSGALSCYRSSD
jgi:uncharacterized Fe-S cluster protein YjdI